MLARARHHEGYGAGRFLLSWRQMLGIAPPEVRRGRKRANAIIAGS